MKSVPSAAHPADIPTSECGVEYQKLYNVPRWYRFGQQPQARDFFRQNLRKQRRSAETSPHLWPELLFFSQPTHSTDTADECEERITRIVSSNIHPALMDVLVYIQIYNIYINIYILIQRLLTHADAEWIVGEIVVLVICTVISSSE